MRVERQTDMKMNQEGRQEDYDRGTWTLHWQRLRQRLLTTIKSHYQEQHPALRSALRLRCRICSGREMRD